MRRLLLLFLLASPVMAQRIVLISGGTVTANVTDSADFYVTLNQNVTGVTLTSTVTPATGYLVSMKFVQDATGSRTVIFGGNISTACVVNSTANSVTICRWQYTASTNAWADAGGGGVSPNSPFPFADIPGEPGVSTVPVRTGLMAEYRILPTETPASLVDYSGNGRNATGTVGTTPTIIATTGGIQCNANGGVVLPSSVNAALDVFIYTGFQSNFAPNGGSQTFYSLLQGNGNGTTTNNSGLTITDYTVNTYFQHYANVIWPNKNGNLTADSVQAFNGTGLLEWSMPPSQDKLYLNGTELAYDNAVGGSSAGINIFPFQICGAAAGSGLGNTSYYQGQIYYLVLYNRVLNAAERAAVSNYMLSAMAARGVPVNLQLTSVSNDTAAFIGDSMVQGFNALSHPTSNNVVLVNTPTIINVGNPGVNTAQTSTADPSYFNQFFQKAAARNSVIFMMGTNDACNGGFVAATSAAQLAQTLHRQKIANGQKIILSTIPDCGSGSSSAGKNALNAYIRQFWRQWNADALADIAANTNIGADGTNANTAFFLDTVHWTTDTQYNESAPIWQRAYNRLFGNTDFSMATTYSTSAAAAVATTAGSESGNTMTFTFAATPANCQVGNQILIAGTTPAGYSRATGWTIITRTATQVTAWNNTTGLGAISVQGTGVCPMQQDADVMMIWSFGNTGTGNGSLESCVGYTGQRIGIRNIAATASTIVPFSAETITGAGATPATLAANTTAILEDTLVSPTAAGCNWVRVQ